MKKTLALVLVLVMALSLFAGCNQKETTTKDTLVFVTYQAPDNLDPMYSVWGEKNTLHNIYDCLVKFDANGKMAPALAESWELSEDGLTYTFKLRQGVTFHDGSAFSADDVIFSMDTMMASAMNGAISFFASWSKVDDFTVTVSRNAPSVNLLEALAMVGFIVPSETYNAETFPTAPIGTGAYKFVSQAEDDSVTLVLGTGEQKLCTIIDLWDTTCCENEGNTLLVFVESLILYGSESSEIMVVKEDKHTVRIAVKEIVSHRNVDVEQTLCLSVVRNVCVVECSRNNESEVEVHHRSEVTVKWTERRVLLPPCRETAAYRIPCLTCDIELRIFFHCSLAPD